MRDNANHRKNRGPFWFCHSGTMQSVGNPSPKRWKPTCFESFTVDVRPLAAANHQQQQHQPNNRHGPVPQFHRSNCWEIPPFYHTIQCTDTSVASPSTELTHHHHHHRGMGNSRRDTTSSLTFHLTSTCKHTRTHTRAHTRTNTSYNHKHSTHRNEATRTILHRLSSGTGSTDIFQPIFTHTAN